MTFNPMSSSTTKFTDYARLYSMPFQAGQLSEVLPIGESVSIIEPCHYPPAMSNMPTVSQPNHFEVTKTAERARLSSACYDLGTGISKLKYYYAVCCLL